MNYQTHIILARGIKLDREYQNILNYTEDEMLNLVNTNKINEVTNASFVQPLDKSRAYIDYPLAFTNIMSANYLAFKNINYGNKWFFAFIDKIEYISNKNCRIYFTIDEMSTWWDYWWYQNCFVEREHVSNDTFGLHTLPEDLETGEYISNAKIYNTSFGGSPDTLCYVLASTTSWHTKVDPLSPAVPQPENGGGRYNGILSGAKYYRFDMYPNGTSGLADALGQMSEAGQIENVVGVFMAPKVLCSLKENTQDNEINGSLLPYESGTNVGDNTILDGYTPRNKKLLCYPYNYLMLDNGSGQQTTYRYEDFDTSNNQIISFGTHAVLCPSCSLKIVPRNYKGETNAYNFAVTGGKYPICNYQVDMYTNWLSQQSINTPLGTINTMELGLTSSILSTLSSASMDNVGGVVSGYNSIFETLRANKNHMLTSAQSQGASSSGDVNTALGINTPTWYKMSIKSEYARAIDSFFDRFGYKVMRTKLPEFTSRENWNYVKIGSTENIGYDTYKNNISVPKDSMDIINRAFRNGTTIWHNHNNLGNYSLSNNIVQ